jgi:hypothetical protein
MEAAEDAIFGQRGAQLADEKRLHAHLVQEFLRELTPLLPLVIQAFEIHGYPRILGTFDRQTLTVDGVQRVGWLVYSGYESNDNTYILSDGTFVEKEYGSRVLPLEHIPWQDRHTEVLRHIRRMIDYK